MNKLYKGLVGALLFFAFAFWLSVQMAMPLFTPISKLTMVSFSWLGLPIVGTYAFTGLFGAVVVALIQSLKLRCQTMRSPKFILIPALCFGVLGAVVNYANYYVVIEPYGLVQCPDKVGYGKSLLRDYVTDIKYCIER